MHPPTGLAAVLGPRGGESLLPPPGDRQDQLGAASSSGRAACRGPRLRPGRVGQRAAAAGARAAGENAGGCLHWRGATRCSRRRRGRAGRGRAVRDRHCRGGQRQYARGISTRRAGLAARPAVRAAGGCARAGARPGRGAHRLCVPRWLRLGRLRTSVRVRACSRAGGASARVRLRVRLRLLADCVRPPAGGGGRAARPTDAPRAATASPRATMPTGTITGERRRGRRLRSATTQQQRTGMLRLATAPARPRIVRGRTHTHRHTMPMAARTGGGRLERRTNQRGRPHL